MVQLLILPFTPFSPVYDHLLISTDIGTLFCSLLFFFAWNFLERSQNRGLVILYMEIFSIPSLLGVLMGTPTSITISVRFNKVSLSSSLGRTIPKWDLVSNCIGAVSILVQLYLTWKVNTRDTSSSGLDSTLFIRMIISSSLSVLTVL